VGDSGGIGPQNQRTSCVKKVKMKVESVSWYCQSAFTPWSRTTSESVAGGMAIMSHSASDSTCTAMSVRPERAMTAKTERMVSSKTVPAYLAQSHAPSGEYSQITGRLASSGGRCGC
jgi:hypothetical protein